MTKFFVGLHIPYHARYVERCMVSINRLHKRRSDFAVGEWLMDSGAFTTVNKHGGYPEPLEVYAEQICRWSWTGRLVAAVSQDYMCEPFVLKRTGLSVAEHQRLTIERYAGLRRLVPSRVHVMPVLQGYAPSDYVSHVRQYGDLLAPGMWVGVGSVCKRNADAGAIAEVLRAVQSVRPDLRLHGFGIKVISLASPEVTSRLYSADSMAWSFAARYEGRDQNCPTEALAYTRTVADAIAASRFVPRQLELLPC